MYNFILELYDALYNMFLQLYGKTMLDIIETDNILAFKDEIKKYLPLKQRDIFILKQCIIFNRIEMAKILLDNNLYIYNEYENIILMNGLTSEMFKMIITKRAFAFHTMEYIYACFKVSDEFVDIALDNKKSSISWFVEYVAKKQDIDVLERTFNKIPKSFLLYYYYKKDIGTHQFYIASVQSLEVAKLYDKYHRLEKSSATRFSYAISYDTIDVIEYLLPYNDINAGINHLLECKNKELHYDKLKYLLSKGAIPTVFTGYEPFYDILSAYNFSHICISSEDRNGDCSICLEPLNNYLHTIVKLPCKHCFHRYCFNSWKNNCPLCRMEVN